MDYIYAELDPKLLLDKVKVYFGYCKQIPELLTELPETVYECTDYTHFKNEGWCIQDYSVPGTTPQFLLFIFPEEWGQLDHIYNGVFDVKDMWQQEHIITLKGIKYRLWASYNKYTPQVTTSFKFTLPITLGGNK